MILLTPYKHYYEQVDGKTIDITDEIPFDLPDSWAWCRLGILCKIKGGKRVPKGDDLLDEPTPYVYLRVTDMKAGTICDFKKKYISEETFKKIANYTISKDDVYLTIAGTIGLGMRPASPMVRRKRDFFEWEFTKKMNAVGLR